MRVAIIEDDTQQAETTAAFLSRFSSERERPISYTIFTTGDDAIKAYKPVWDLILLDIEMPGTNGMDVARAIRANDQKVEIVFITQLAGFAIEGYEVRAFDYILKPVAYAPFALKLDRVCQAIDWHRDAQITVTNQTGSHRIACSDALYIASEDHRLTFHLACGTSLSTTTTTLAAVQDELAPQGFARCHKKYLVNLRYVGGYQKDAVTLSCPGAESVSLPLSRSFRSDFLKALLTRWEG